MKETFLMLIKRTLKDGGTVVVTTATRSTKYSKPQYADWFSGDNRGDLYVKSGRKRVCISYCDIRCYSGASV